MEEPAVKQCCAVFYSSDVARFLLGDSFHPGGAALTRRLGTLLDLSPDSHVLQERHITRTQRATMHPASLVPPPARVPDRLPGLKYHWSWV